MKRFKRDQWFAGFAGAALVLGIILGLIGVWEDDSRWIWTSGYCLVASVGLLLAAVIEPS